jgi:lipopolysaccharide biosynthesis protein
MLSLLRKVVSLGYWLLDTEKSLSDFRKNAPRKEEDIIVESPANKLMSPLVITAHVYYSDFAKQLIESLKQLPRDTKVYATTTSKVIKQNLEIYLEAAGHPHDVRITPNTGRNFAPLLVEFSKQLLTEKSFIHVHSKKSPHSPRIAGNWLKKSTDLLLTRSGLQRISSLCEENAEIGMVYADSSDLLWGMNFRWGRSKKISRKTFGHLSGFEGIKWSGRLAFPAGGMFWVKTDAIRPLLEIDWKYENFKPESHRRDGDLQHGVERMLGELTLSQGFHHAVKLTLLNQFGIRKRTPKDVD